MYIYIHKYLCICTMIAIMYNDILKTTPSISGRVHGAASRGGFRARFGRDPHRVPSRVTTPTPPGPS